MVSAIYHIKNVKDISKHEGIYSKKCSMVHTQPNIKNLQFHSYIISFITNTNTLAPHTPIFPDPSKESGSSQEKQTQQFIRSKSV